MINKGQKLSDVIHGRPQILKEHPVLTGPVWYHAWELLLETQTPKIFIFIQSKKKRHHFDLYLAVHHYLTLHAIYPIDTHPET